MLRRLLRNGKPEEGLAGQRRHRRLRPHFPMCPTRTTFERAPLSRSHSISARPLTQTPFEAVLADNVVIRANHALFLLDSGAARATVILPTP